MVELILTSVGLLDNWLQNGFFLKIVIPESEKFSAL